MSIEILSLKIPLKLPNIRFSIAIRDSSEISLYDSVCNVTFTVVF